ncbi:uncharacterized protein [Misgurnus anguillicaudatus]|uniref:uncharacterized protein isoform X1 n=1 Tax=Misgurnus anguillicaudatus TaxID=75329 RepID=UPI003CCFDF7B
MDWLYLRNIAFLSSVFIVFILHVSIDAQDQPQQCLVFKVVRGIVHKVCLSKSLKISCSLKTCDEEPINIIWSKTEDSVKWMPVNETHQISSSQKPSGLKYITSYLIFTNISKHHEGLYRCDIKLPHMSAFSHYINISVSDDSNGTEMSCGEMTEAKSNDLDPWWLPYLFICMGIVTLIFIVMLISILCINGCNCLKKKETEAVQVQDSDETQRHKRDLLRPPEQSTPYKSDDADDILSTKKDNPSRQVVYASLNHFIPKQSSTTSCRTETEFTEYASIRVS